MQIYLACVLCYGAVVCAAIPLRIRTDSTDYGLEDRGRNVKTESGELKPPMSKDLDIKARGNDYTLVVENSIGMPVVHHPTTESSHETVDHLIEDAQVNGKENTPEESENDQQDVEINNQIPQSASIPHDSPREQIQLPPTTPKSTTTTTTPNPPSKPTHKKRPEHKTHPTLRPEDLDEDSTFEDLTKDWNEPIPPSERKRTTHQNSPYLHTLYPAKELSVPQRLYFSKVDEVSGERAFFVYEVREGDTLGSVARKLGVGIRVVVGAAPLYVDGEFE